jgi:hypothetical protein
VRRLKQQQHDLIGGRTRAVDVLDVELSVRQ